ncbi:disintegrin and metalloproteinase domain-containing protein 10-like [Tachypleus tridentatus]|uniref:disintegrin and metalloproteinase domain-containing protein 10-like n=1 Tax=Tachypleus tridentatus TaxID=6853 RepID=UPI003FD6A6C6
MGSGCKIGSSHNTGWPSQSSELLIPSTMSCSTIKYAERLNEYIQHYETLSYDVPKIYMHTLRTRRSSAAGEEVHIQFYAHKRKFHLRLKRDTSVFSPDLVIDTPAGKLTNVDISHLYKGDLFGEQGSMVYGSISDGLFDGKIHTLDKTYFVEQAHKYFKNASKPFHSIIYMDTDVQDPYSAGRTGHSAGCGVTEEVQQWMENIVNSEVRLEKPLQNKPHFGDGDSYFKRSQRWLVDKYSMVNNNVISPERLQSIKQRRECTLFIQTDIFLWKYVKSHFNKHSDTKIREEIVSLVAQHIHAINQIYENTNFKLYKGIKFVVRRLKINDTSACNETNRLSNPFCAPNIDVSNFLNLNSQVNHTGFCLAYIFTYRDFTGGTLGLAWVASAKGMSGGICEKHKSYREKVGGREVETKRSLNTGVITFLNYNSRVPPKVSELTLAHEIGHNFGSPHDYPIYCKPGGANGNYIMYASATSGDRPNNNKFSSCSIGNISTVLHAVFEEDGKFNCFSEVNGSFCGNKIVEEGEECDCGWDIIECEEQCCYPKKIDPFLDYEPDAKPCMLRPAHKLSPSKGPCCKESCDFEEKNIKCRDESECSKEALCDGLIADCPDSSPKANKTVCNGETQVCWNGQCVGSICEKYNLEECFLTENISEKEGMCDVACKEPIGKNMPCMSIDKIKDIKKLKLRPGSPCNNFKGYCDVFQVCRSVDAEGPLARLKNLLLDKNTLMDIKEFVMTYWWAVMLMVIGAAIFMGLFIKCCAVHTPSSNPRKPPAIRITDTLRRPSYTLRRMRHRSTLEQFQNSTELQVRADRMLHRDGYDDRMELQVRADRDGYDDPPPPYVTIASCSHSRSSRNHKDQRNQNYDRKKRSHHHEKQQQRWFQPDHTRLPPGPSQHLQSYLNHRM